MTTTLKREKGNKTMSRETTNRRRRGPRGLLGYLLVLVALGAVVLAGCGSSSSGSTETTTSASGEASSSTNGGEAGESGAEAGESGAAAGGGPGKFEISEEAKACLKEQGLELPEFKGGGAPEGGPPTGEGGPPGGAAHFEEMKEAFKACGIEAPGKPGGGGPTANSATFKKQITEYVACVRENGYEMPEPNLSGEGPVFNESEVNQKDPEFKKASAKCQSLLGGSKGVNGSSSGESS
jgi:hypothetical protein